MQCFELQNRMTDYIDGTLSPSLRDQYDQHLKHCRGCTEESGNLREILRVLHDQQRAEIPVHLREDPFSFQIPSLFRKKSPRAIWKGLPMPARLLAEGLGIAVVVWVGIVLGPKLRSMYEASVDQRLQKMITAEDMAPEGAIPLERGKSETAESPHEAEFGEGEGGGEDAAAAAAGDSATEDSDVQVGAGEIWRFNLKTDSPNLVRNKIIKIFRDLGLAEGTPGMGGTEAPGGIQFDLFAPQSLIAQLKPQLEKLAPAKEDQDIPFQETFTWYKNKSKKPVPKGMARVVIWLSQI